MACISYITAYQQIAPSLNFVPFSLCFTDSTFSVTSIGLHEMVDGILAGDITLERILAEADRKYNMIRMETGINQ